MSTPNKRHLYLVLEDWEEGYTVRKIDVESFDDAGGGAADADAKKEPAEALPDPPVIRVEAEHGQAALFTALGTRILALHRSAAAGAGVPVFDTATLGLAVAPPPPPPPQGEDAPARRPTLVSVGGDRVYGLEAATIKAAAGDREVRHFVVLRAPAPPSRKQWSWGTVPAPPPFSPASVACYAVHPDARTVFFSVGRAPAGSGRNGGSGTFSFNTQRLEWTCHGAWLLPFTGQAHYDAKLGAWVGISGGGGGGGDTDAGAACGRVCSCDVVAPGGGRRTPSPEWKLGAEQLFCDDEERHVGAALVHMGDSRFCLLECVKPRAAVLESAMAMPAKADGTGKKRMWKVKQQESYLLHVTAFGLKYGDHGELTAAAMGRRRRSYEVPEGAAKFLEKPVAFWM